MSVFIAKICENNRKQSVETLDPLSRNLLFDFLETKLAVFYDAPVCHFDGEWKSVGKLVHWW